MSREKLAAEAVEAARAAKHNLKWMDKHPERIDQSKKSDMVAYLNKMIGFAEAEMKNTRRPGRVQLRTRLKNLIVSILS